MRISLGDVSLWFDVSGPSVIPQGDATAERCKQPEATLCQAGVTDQIPVSACPVQ